MDAGVLEGLDDADVRESARAAAAEHECHQWTFGPEGDDRRFAGRAAVVRGPQGARAQESQQKHEREPGKHREIVSKHGTSDNQSGREFRRRTGRSLSAAGGLRAATKNARMNPRFKSQQVAHITNALRRNSMTISKLPLVLALAVGGAAQAVAQEVAKDFPTRPVRMIVPNAPGSSVDTLSRIMGTGLSQVLAQQVVIDNRAGAAGVIGMEIAKDSNPDGYTMIAATTAASTIARLLQRKSTFHPVKDYDYVVQFAETPNLLVVTPSLPIKSVAELISYAKANKGRFNMASAGAGSQSHLSGAYFQQAAGIDSLHVPYKGGGASTGAVVAGESHWTLTPAAAVMGHVGAGRLRALGHSLPKATPLLPGIPPIADTVKGFDYSGWQGFFVPKGTNPAVVEKVRAATIKAAESPEVRKQFASQATEIVIRGPEEFRKVVQQSLIQNAKVVEAVGLKGTR
ncbi:MAG: Bug family tripartite tricarboxylate transporter substrate binding protein [Burkholderiales bacterium]